MSLFKKRVGEYVPLSEPILDPNSVAIPPNIQHLGNQAAKVNQISSDLELLFGDTTKRSEDVSRAVDAIVNAATLPMAAATPENRDAIASMFREASERGYCLGIMENVDKSAKPGLSEPHYATALAFMVNGMDVPGQQWMSLVVEYVIRAGYLAARTGTTTERTAAILTNSLIGFGFEFPKP